MSNRSDLTLNITRKINAPAKAVYNAWLNPEMMAKFMIAGDGMSVPRAEADAREGGRFTVIMSGGGREIPHGGEYKKLNPFSQIVFTWESPFSVEGSTVTLNLEEAEGGTNLELIHVKFRDEETRDNHKGGWDAILNSLEKAFE